MRVSQKVPGFEYKKILYATDLSETGRFAFPFAASIASRYGAELTVFHVVESAEFEREVVGYISEDMWTKLKTKNLQEARDIIIGHIDDETAVKAKVSRFFQDSVAGHEDQSNVISYEVVVKTGDPVEKILEEAHGGDYDLVVIGCHGRRVITDVLMGSTALRVLHRCKIPVMSVRLPK